MSAAQHEATAGQEQAAALTHAQQYDPKAERTAPPTCVGTADVGTYSGGGGVCWSSVVNPTEQHRKDAERARQLADKHRAASSALLDAEAKGCAGVSPQDRDTSPFYHREDILSVAPLASRTDPIPTKIVGATIIFRAVPRLSAERLQRAADCHLARAAALGHVVPEMAYCPLVLKGVSATVVAVESGLAVEVSATDDTTAQEIMRRARALRD